MFSGKRDHYAVKGIAKDWFLFGKEKEKQFISINNDNSTVQTINKVV